MKNEGRKRCCPRPASGHPPRVLLVIPTANIIHRQILNGILRYAHRHGPWEFHMITGLFEEQGIRRTKEWGCTGAIAFTDTKAHVAAVLAAWLGWKLWQKYRFRQLATVPHITPDELLAALEATHPPLVLDLRGHTMVAATGPIAGATVAEHDRLLEAVSHWPKNRPVVTLCACPQDAGAIQAAHRLLAAGYLSVRPLLGGYEAWLAATGAPAAAPTPPERKGDRP